MLGFSAISSRAISGSAFKLVSVPLSLSASVGIAFALGGTSGLYLPMSATARIVFAGTPTLFVNQAISATVGITFNGTPTLRLAGKPLVLRAIPQSFTLNADKASYTLKAVPQSFTVRGVK
jgi:hypothetical protein